MNYELRKIQDADVKGKIVFLRADLDVPIENSKVADDTRLNAWFVTLEYLVREKAQVIIAGHLGRPKPISNFKFQISNSEKFSLEPVVKWICKKINSKPQVIKLKDFNGWKLAENVFILENLRFYKEEEGNDEEFSK